MRIESVPAERAAENVQRLYSDSAERLGRVALPLTVFAHCPPIADAYSALAAAFHASQTVAPRLKTLACIRAAQIAGCPF